MALVMEEPSALPVDLAELKAFLRIEGSGEDAMLAALLRSAAATCEAFVGEALLLRTVSETVAAGARWARLGKSPVRQIDELARIEDGGATVLPVSDYAIDIDADGSGWVRVLQPLPHGPVRVRYTVGLAEDANGVSEPLRHGILRLAAHGYGARGEAEAPPPASIAALWRPWRRVRVG